PAAKRPPGVGQICGKNRITFIKVTGAEAFRKIPAMPALGAALELFGLPAEVCFFVVADREGPVAEKLRIPLRQAKLPGHFGAAPFPLPLEPAAIHAPIPAKRSAVLAEEHRLHPLRAPMLEPVAEFLH